MARASNAASATTSTGATNQLTGECRRLWVRNDAGSAADLRVRVRNNDQTSAGGSIHGAVEFTILAAGEEQVFDASSENPINTLHCYTASGTATFSFTVTGA